MVRTIAHTVTASVLAWCFMLGGPLAVAQLGPPLPSMFFSESCAVWAAMMT